MLEKFNRYKRRQKLTTAELRQKVQILSASTRRKHKTEAYDTDFGKCMRAVERFA